MVVGCASSGVFFFCSFTDVGVPLRYVSRTIVYFVRLVGLLATVQWGACAVR